jgi:hypothetical protein
MAQKYLSTDEQQFLPSPSSPNINNNDMVAKLKQPFGIHHFAQYFALVFISARGVLCDYLKTNIHAEPARPEYTLFY